jgi:uncharacterized protein (TIGR03437 family)
MNLNRVIVSAALIGTLVNGIARAQTTVKLRSGNGITGGRDSSVTFLVGPSATDFPNPFTLSDFSNAQRGPVAYVLSRNPAWISGLSVDASAQWIGTNANAARTQGTTALYAISFVVPNAFSSAELTVHYAVDDAFGCNNCPNGRGTNKAVFLNGTAVCASSLFIDNGITDFTQEHIVACNDVGGSLHVGTNWLYIDAVNLGSVGGLLFSATISTTDVIVPSINAGGVVNAASSVRGAVAPGSIASVYGGFPLNGPSQVSGTPWPISLSGVSMRFGGVQAPLVYASTGLLNLQVPWELAGQTQTSLTATVGSQTSVAQTVNLLPLAPGIFSMNGQGTGQGAILDPQYRLVDSSNPASVSGVIQIYCTGLGPVTNQPPTGSPASADPLAETTTMPTVTIGGLVAQVLYSGLAPGNVGLYQVNAQVPAGIVTGTAVPVAIAIGGVTSNTVTVSIQPFPPSPNPQPSITSLSPSSATVGTAALALTINGSGFVPYSSITFNGMAHTPSSFNGGVLSIPLTLSDLAIAGSFPVVVTNPSPGGGTSNTIYFNVSPTVEVIRLTGAWQGTWSSTLGFRGSATANLTQTGNALNGTISLADSPCFSSGTVSGTISGNQISLALTFSGGQKASFKGAANLAGNAITGQYTVQTGSCAGDTGGIAIGKN